MVIYSYDSPKMKKPLKIQGLKIGAGEGFRTPDPYAWQEEKAKKPLIIQFLEIYCFFKEF